MEKYIELKGVSEDFVPKHIFECGQCFRFVKEKDESYTIIANDKVVNVSAVSDKILIKNTTDEEFSDFWYNYFDMSTDYKNIKQRLSADTHLKKSAEFGNGIRILNQDLWECIVSFIISANNNIPRIQGIIERFCREYGEKIEAFGNTYYSFPQAEKLLELKKEDLHFLRAGYRDSYLIDAFQKVGKSDIVLEEVSKLSTKEAKDQLLKIKGVGNKVADCILLFGNGRRETFPVDVWVKRSIEGLYSDELGELSIQEFAKNKFSDLAGYAQQYLFYYMRENTSGGKTDGKK